MSHAAPIHASHLQRTAVVYVRQSTPKQLIQHQESTRRQYQLAERACRAALTILSRLPGLNEKWKPVIGEPMGIGVGLNTGMATVGNVGSQYKFKYGARGTTAAAVRTRSASKRR